LNINGEIPERAPKIIPARLGIQIAGMILGKRMDKFLGLYYNEKKIGNRKIYPGRL